VRPATYLGLWEFRDLGREQALAKRQPLVRAFTWLFGPIGLHSRIRAGHVIRRLRRLALPARARVLDAGCGRGLVLFWLARQRSDYVLRGIELDPQIVAGCQAVARQAALAPVEFLVGDLASGADLGGPYDLIVSVDVLEHILDDVGVLRRLRGALAPIGRLLLHLPLRHQEQARVFAAFREHTVPDHVRDEYTPAEIRQKLAETGFAVELLEYGFGPAGELAFELNTLFWRWPAVRAALALLTYPLAWWLAYRDINADLRRGNSLVILARPQAEGA
jgi:2-polyprenyl-3-methyl-5-hydroxy-6-metoxy-1,4-benzoquinol methylase